MPTFQDEGPKYKQLAEYFRSQLMRGELQPGDRLPSLVEMREQHGASRPTVERAHALLEKEGLIERKPSAGAFVRGTHRSETERSRKTRGIIGLSGEGFNFSEYSPYWAHLMSGAREAAARTGAQLLILNPDTVESWEKTDGVLVCDWRAEGPKVPAHALPLVSLLTPVAGLCSVMADDEAGGYAVTRHLLELGHTRIGFLHGYPHTLTARHRVAGYMRAMQESGIAADPLWTRCLIGKYYWGKRFTIEARRNMQLWLQDDWNQLGCTALLCHNDEAALGAIQAFTEAGQRVPQDVSIAGFDGTEFCDLVSPGLTSVRLPLREIGAAGVELLLEQIQSDAASDEHKTLPIQLKTRASTGAPSHS